MPYQVEELVGGGLYADVYRATGPNGTVALKVARTSSRAESAQTLAWFAAEAVNFHTGSTGPAFLSAEGMNNLIAVEAEQLRKLRHPAFVRLLDSGMAWHGADARRYLVTEWIQGRTWRQMLDLGERIPLRAVLDVVLALVWAEQFEKQLWHGDIKPENLLFDESGRLHIIDPSAGATCFDKTGTPTQILLTNWYNPWLDASDIPAIGVLLMEVATGSQPLLFASRTPSERPIGEELGRLLQHSVIACRGEQLQLLPWLPFPSDLNANIAPPLEAVMLRCLGLQRQGQVLDFLKPYHSISELSEVLAPLVQADTSAR